MPDQPTPAAVPVPIASDRAWFDPALIGRNLYWQVTPVVYTGDGNLALAPANPNRWAIGFEATTNAGTPYNVAPGSVPGTDGGWRVTPDTPRWFYLPEFGPLVMADWWGNVPGPGPYRVFEVIRLVHWREDRVQRRRAAGS